MEVFDRQRVQWLSRNWISVIGVGIGIIGLAVAYYSYAQSKRERIPRFVIEAARSEILRADRIAETPIRILKRNDDTEITEDVTSITFYFWNAGKEPIKEQHVRIPITISIDDSTAEILDFQVVKISHPVTQFVLTPHLSDGDSTENHLRSLQITFDILENEQGAVCQILYSGNREAKISINGYIEGFGDLISSTASMTSKTYEVWQVVIWLISVLILIALLKFLEYVFEISLKRVFRRWQRVLGFFSYLIVAAGLIYFVIVFLPSQFKVTHSSYNVPSSLIFFKEMQVD
ncbi:MAG: hypothetical protein IIB00_05040 [candidate division Zixibacteria bacterium]|nr:hypothetical protein [candidate division Zixibacteria bacterium]